MNLADIREDIAQLLAGANANVYFYPPEVPMLPAIIIVPADPYCQPIALGSSRFKIKYNITFAVAATNNQAALNTVEELMFYSYENLPVGYTLLNTTAPRPLSLGQTEVIAAELEIETVIQTN